jgi:osmotically-inducible protein OsmY
MVQARAEEESIMRKMILMVFVFALAIVGGHAQSVTRSPDSATIEDVRSKLLRLPYYGVFDFLAFSYEKGTVTLSGYVYHTSLKSDAERAVKQAARVDQVVNNIEELPVSSNDDDLRWKTYYAIYTDPFLSRYAPGGGVLWGHRHRVPRTLFGSAVRFPGEEPVGIYPIAIIVKNGRITLMGVVDSEADKTMAGMKARGVPGAFAVENELAVEGGT